MSDPGPAATPGWYPHPSMVDTERYWDGSGWTDHIAPGGRRPDVKADSTPKLEMWGWLTTFMLPMVGVVIAIILISRPGKNDGGWILGISLAWIMAAWAFLNLVAMGPY